MTQDWHIWLYAVTRDSAAAGIGQLPGVGGEPVQTVTVDGLAAVLGPVRAEEFGQEPLSRNLEDLSWLETVARAHHRVVDVIARSAPVVPMRLATVYREEQRVVDVLVRRHGDFVEALNRVADRTEWGVKAYAVPGMPETAPAPAGEEDRPGLAYLRRRRSQLSGREVAQEAALRAAESVHDVLARHVEAVTRHRPQDNRLTGEAGWMVLNGAYLAAAEAAAEFAALVRSLADRHPELRLELTGPWPPYSFAAMQPAQVVEGVQAAPAPEAGESPP